MIKNELQFIVVGVVHGVQFTALGRCGGVPIHVGDMFDAIYRHKHRRWPDELGDDPVREVEKPAAIRVVCIHAYERSLKMLGQGATGSLALEGDGLQYLAPGWILGRRSEIPALVTPESHPASVSS